MMTFLAALLGIIFLVANLAMRDRAQKEAKPRDITQPPTYVRDTTQARHPPRANDEFKTPSRSANLGTPPRYSRVPLGAGPSAAPPALGPVDERIQGFRALGL